jgi:L-amino acid N-acyltransferase YncA
MIDDTLQILRATQADAHVIARIWLDCIGSHPAAPTEAEAIAAFDDRIRLPQGASCIWVAVENDVVVGWQSLNDFGTTQITKAGMSSTYVSPTCHSKGVGKRLLAHATAQARACGFDYIVAFIRTDNTACIRIVAALGWVLVGPLPRNLADGTELAYYSYAVPPASAG